MTTVEAGLGSYGCKWTVLLLTQSLVAHDTLELSGLLDRPLSNIRPLLRSILIFKLLLRVTDLPPGFPVVGELFVERCGNG